MLSDVEPKGCFEELKEMMESIEPMSMEREEANRIPLGVLSQRLELIRSWGGAYSQVDFSPHVKEYMGNLSNVNTEIITL